MTRPDEDHTITYNSTQLTTQMDNATYDFFILANTGENGFFKGHFKIIKYKQRSSFGFDAHKIILNIYLVSIKLFDAHRIIWSSPNNSNNVFGVHQIS